MFDLITGREKHLPSHGDVMEVRLLRIRESVLIEQKPSGNGVRRSFPIRVPFILTVTLSFFLEAPK